MQRRQTGSRPVADFVSIYRDMRQVPPGEQPRITDLSSIQAENFKFRNTSFLYDKDLPYDMLKYQSRERLRHRIWNVRNGDLRKLMRRFPINHSLCEQCAGWMHAVAGRHFFPDANHRTALALLRKLLKDNGIVPGQWPPQVLRETVIRSHKVRKEIEDIRLDTLYRRDRMFLVWILFFKTVLRSPTEER